MRLRESVSAPPRILRCDLPNGARHHNGSPLSMPKTVKLHIATFSKIDLVRGRKRRYATRHALSCCLRANSGDKGEEQGPRICKDECKPERKAQHSSEQSPMVRLQLGSLCTMHELIDRALGHQPCTSHHAGCGIGGLRNYTGDLS